MTVLTMPASAGVALTRLFMRPRRMPQGALARRMGVPLRTVRDLCSDRIPITDELAVRLVRAFPDTTPDTWLFLQRRADAFRAKYPHADPRKPVTLAVGSRLLRWRGMRELVQRLGADVD